MTQVVQGMVTIVKALKPRERNELIEALLESGILSEDQQDALLIASRRDGRRRPFDTFVAGLRKQGRLP